MDPGSTALHQMAVETPFFLSLSYPMPAVDLNRVYPVRFAFQQHRNVPMNSRNEEITRQFQTCRHIADKQANIENAYGLPFVMEGCMFTTPWGEMRVSLSC